MLTPLIALLALAFSSYTYLYLERLGRRALVPLLCRAVGWGALGLLLADVSCGHRVGPAAEPLVLLDGSLSLRAAGGRWTEARDSALRLGHGSVLVFGDERSGADTALARGRSQLAPAVRAAVATGRPVVVVTDGEIEDAGEIPRDVRARLAVQVYPRRLLPDLAITRVDGPARVGQGDSLTLDVEVRAVGRPAADSVGIELRSESGRLARRVVRLPADAVVETTLSAGTAGWSPGDHLLTVALPNSGDAESRDDSQLFVLTVTKAPGVVLLADPGDWDARFLFRTLREVTRLPVRGFIRLTADRWRSMTDLAPVPSDLVRQAAQRADLVVAKGAAGVLLKGTKARGIWRWPSGEDGGTVIASDWYLSVKPSPVAGAFVALPIDSFPPATQISSLQPDSSSWVGLVARVGRSGAERPIMIGRERAGVREVVVGADGLWRWAFRGGSSEAGYRAWVAATSSWLLGGAEAGSRTARPVRAVADNGRPLVFEWAGSGAPSPVPITLEGATTQLRDTLRFDGRGRAQLWAPVGRYTYRADGSSGLIAVQEYSEEWLARPVTLSPQAGEAAALGATTHAREWLWLFALCILALAGEWGARRSMGLR